MGTFGVNVYATVNGLTYFADVNNPANIYVTNGMTDGTYQIFSAGAGTVNYINTAAGQSYFTVTSATGVAVYVTNLSSTSATLIASASSESTVSATYDGIKTLLTIENASQTVERFWVDPNDGAISKAGDEFTWVGFVSGNWNVPGNWEDTTAGTDPAAVAPGAKDSVTFDSSTSYYQVIGGAGDAAYLTFNGDNIVTGQLKPGVLTVGNRPYYFSVLDIDSGATISANTVDIANGSTISVSGSDAVLMASSGIVIGEDESTNNGLLSAADGAEIKTASLVVNGYDADLSVDVESSIEIGALGGAAIGALTIDPGALLTESVNAFERNTIYGSVINNGQIVVSDGELAFSEGSLSGTGTIDIQNGGTVALSEESLRNLSFDLASDASLIVAQASAGNTIDLAGANDILTIAPYYVYTAGYESSTFGMAAAISGFNATDVLLVDGVVTDATYVAGAVAGTGGLVLTDGSDAVTTLTLDGKYTGNTFLAIALSNGETEIVLSTTVTTNGSIDVPSGGTISNSLIYAGGFEKIEAGGVDNSPTIAGGTLELVAGGTIGGDISFSGINSTLIIDPQGMTTTIPPNTLNGFSSGDVIELPGISFVGASSIFGEPNADSYTVASAGTLTIDADGTDYNIVIGGVTIGQDNFVLSGGNQTAAAGLAITMNGAPVIAAPNTKVVGVGQAIAITGLSLAETGNTTGETFTVKLTDTNGLLSATGTGVSGSSSKSLAITGSLAQVNAALATVKDTDGTVGTDSITLAATDSLGYKAAGLKTAVTINGLPVLAAPSTTVVGVGKSTAIVGFKLSETGTTTGETFTVKLTDTNGLLSVTGTGVSGAGTKSLTIAGSLTQVNADLATVKDTDATMPSDTIALAVTDSFGNKAAAASIAVTVNGLPVITAQTTATVGIGKSTTIAGISLSESGNTTGETFTVTLADTHGLLSATGTGVTGSGSKSLTVTGSLAQVNADLATLKDTDATAGTESITLAATDSLANKAAGLKTTVTVNGLPALATPSATVVGIGQATAVSGLSLSETGTTTGETFTVTLSDTNGLLSATGTGVTGAGTSALTIAGSLAQVNADLATVKDTDSTTPSDTIALAATDSFGNKATAASIAVTVNGLPVIAAPTIAVVGVGQATAITGLSLSETSITTGEAFTVTLADTTGLLSATGTGVTGSGTKALTIAGSLAQVNADLATVKDTDATTASDTVTLAATDSFGNHAAATSVAVTVNGLPVLAAPATATVGFGQATAITGLSLSETGTTTTETFRATLTDTNGLLSATGTGVSGSGTKALTVVGTLAQVNAALATVKDTDTVTPSDTITVAAHDSFSNYAATKTIAVTVHGLPAIAAPATATVGAGQAIAITGLSLSETGTTTTETFRATLTDTNGLLSATGTGVSGSGTKALTVVGTLAQVNAALATVKDTDTVTPSDTITVAAHDSFGNYAATKTIAVTVDGSHAIEAPAIAMVSVGSETVVLGAATENVTAGDGTALVQATSGFAGALINDGTVGSAGTTMLEIIVGGTATLNSGDAKLIVKLDAATNLSLGTASFITAEGAIKGGDTITAGSTNQTLESIGGKDTLVGFTGFGDTFLGTAAGFSGDVIKNFGGSEGIDFTDIMKASFKSLAYSGNATSGNLTVTDGTHSGSVTLDGSYTLASFNPVSDGHRGTLIQFV